MAKPKIKITELPAYSAVLCPKYDSPKGIGGNCVTITPLINNMDYAIEKKCKECVEFTMDNHNTTGLVFKEIICSYKSTRNH